jgi:medium-chain acyl-[acyl-carrier-protein] hydrolase
MTRLEDVVEALVETLQPHLDIPFAVFGHSLGALIGFEVIRCLREQENTGPFHLFVSAYRAPQLSAREPKIHHLPDNDFLKAVHSRYNSVPQAVLDDPEFMELLLPALKADFKISETYVYVAGKPLDCPVTAFGGAEDGVATEEDLAAWRHQTINSFELRMLPGGHFFLETGQSVILDAISRELK